ncbi:unnamed protein product [Paramecium octaurelia]|uniref:Uncharacterized protein n=1 Tax=Paramecium octaurelia TaxID=43137 RepID=A0A8S1T7E5_PAROT|nr:unnamed protein product [Paramecium octaurelia]
MKNKIFILIILCLANTQEQWDIIQKSLQDTNTMDASGWFVRNNQNGWFFSTCDGFTLLGGYNIFGTRSIVSKHFSLLPHYKVKVTLEFWKIDSWDDEDFYIIVDGTLQSKKYFPSQGIQLCGDYWKNEWKEVVEPITIIMNHNSESLIIIITSNLNESPRNESWGIRDFTLSILRCPSGCLYCSDNNYNNCYQWVGFQSFWHESIITDGWMKNDNIKPATSYCVSFDLVGGFLNLAPNDKLEKIIQNLGFHYQIQINVQLWKIDTWNNENFELLVDDQIYYQTVLETTGFYSICGSTGLEKIFNIAVTLSHSSSSCKITMRTNHNPATTDAYWGIRALNIYIANNCYDGCDLCLGPLKTDCTACSRGWVFYNNLCINCIHISQQQSHLFFYHKFKLIKLKIQSQMKEFLWRQIYQNNLRNLHIDNQQQFINIDYPSLCKMLSKQKNEQLFYKVPLMLILKLEILSHYCYPTINSILYNVRFQLSEQELIINTSNTECSIYQVVDVGGELIQIKILEILQQDV